MQTEYPMRTGKRQHLNIVLPASYHHQPRPSSARFWMALAVVGTLALVYFQFYYP